MPVMEPDLDAATLQAVGARVDEGPFSSLCWGERIAFDNPETLTLLGAVAAWTDRVPLVTTVVVPQLHDPVMLAKALATGDMLSGGRLTVGIGVGGRHEDYHAVGADLSTQTMREMAERVAVMKRVWAGEKVTDSVLPVGPAAGAARRTPSCWSAPSGPRPCAAPPAWADGLAGMTLDLDVAKQNELFDVARDCLGAGRQAAHRTWPRRSGSRSGTATGPRAGAPPPAPLHELDPGRVRRRHGADHRLGRHRGGTGRRAAHLRGHRHRRGAPDPDELRRRPVAPGRRRRRRLPAEGAFIMSFGDYQLEIYLQGLSGVLPSLPMSFAELEAKAEAAMSPSVWSYVAGGAGDERTQRGQRHRLRRLGPDAADVRRRHRARPVGRAVRDDAGPSPVFMAPIGVIGLCAPGRPRRPGHRPRRRAHRRADDARRR